MGAGRVDVERGAGWEVVVEVVVVVVRRVDIGRDKGGWRRVVDGGRIDEGDKKGVWYGWAEVGRVRNDGDGKADGGGIRVLA